MLTATSVVIHRRGTRPISVDGHHWRYASSMCPDDERPPTSSLTCFVIGPIGNRHGAIGSPERSVYEESLAVMAEVLEPACAAHGLAPVRADTLARAGEITEQIFRRLREDDVVIADVTDANPNVMYELGLRHTRDKLTLQIGEYGRLPFDVNTIRTIQFSRSDIGLINARKELIEVLESGLRGDYDPVTATRIWNETASVDDAANTTWAADGADGALADEVTDEPFLDVMVEAEEKIEELPSALSELTECVGAMGELAGRATEEIARSDSAGKGMRGRMQVAVRYAAGLDEIAERLETGVEHYVDVLQAVSGGTFALISAMEKDSEALEQGQDFGMVVRQLASTTRESMASLAAMADSIRENARLSKVMKGPSHRVTAALDKFAEATSIMDEWDRRLQSLGVPMPSDDWEPDFGDENEPPEAGPSSGNDHGVTETVEPSVEHVPQVVEDSDPPRSAD